MRAYREEKLSSFLSLSLSIQHEAHRGGSFILRWTNERMNRSRRKCWSWGFSEVRGWGGGCMCGSVGLSLTSLSTFSTQPPSPGWDMVVRVCTRTHVYLCRGCHLRPVTSREHVLWFRPRAGCRNGSDTIPTPRSLKGSCTCEQATTQECSSSEVRGERNVSFHRAGRAPSRHPLAPGPALPAHDLIPRHAHPTRWAP